MSFGPVSSPGGGSSSTTTSNLVGVCVHTTPDPAANRFAVDGSTYTNQALADYLTASPIVGFVVVGSDVTTPDWSGRALMSPGALGITGAPGSLIPDTTAANGLTGSVVGPANPVGTQVNGGGGNSVRSTTTRTVNITSTDNHTRPNAVVMPICIIGCLLYTSPSPRDRG